MQIRIADLPGSMAAALHDALAPDNVDFPQGQSMNMEVTGDTLTISVSGGTLAQFIATVDEVLEHASTALGAASQ